MGGTILFGIDEEAGFALVGVYDLQDLQKRVTDQYNQMNPPVRAVFTTAGLYGYSICSAEIPGIDLSERPCYYEGAGRLKGSFIRVGDADKTMTDHVHDVTQVAGLMDGAEEELYGDSGYLGAEKREEAILTNGHGKEIQYIICARPSSLKKRYAGAEYEKAIAADHAKASIRCKAEHVFAVVKGMFRFRKTRLRGLTKVNAQLHMLFALANLILAARPSLAV